MDWQFYEYLSYEMEIIEEVLNTDLSLQGQMLFWGFNNDNIIADSKLANKKFNK